MPPARFPVDPKLKHLVQHYWIARRTFRDHHNTFSIYPDTRIELIFNAGAPLYLSAEDTRQTLAPCFVVGLLETATDVAAEGEVSLVAARLYPWAYTPLLFDVLTRPAVGIQPTNDLLQQQASSIQQAHLFSDRMLPHSGLVEGTLGILTVTVA